MVFDYVVEGLLEELVKGFCGGGCECIVMFEYVCEVECVYVCKLVIVVFFCMFWFE